MFGNGFDDLEKEYNETQQQDNKLDNQFGQNKNPFANSITKDILVKSKQGIEEDLGNNLFEDKNDEMAGNNKFNKKNLAIDIDENEDYD